MTRAKTTKPRRRASKKVTVGSAAARDPQGGLTAAGRRAYRERDGSRLRPGVTRKGADMSREDLKRKGSFLRRHFTHPRGPLRDDAGRPTRLALSAQAWGEVVPKTMAAAKKLADKGRRLLDRCRRSRQNLRTR